MKKLTCLLIVLIALSVTACEAGYPITGQDEPVVQEELEKPGSDTPINETIKIGVLVGAVSGDSEELKALKNVKQKYGDVIEVAEYPEDLVHNEESIVKAALSLAENGCGAIIISQAAEGAVAAVDKVREAYPDTLIILGQDSEGTGIAADKADIVLTMDSTGVNAAVVRQAHKMGAETFVHYTFPRQMANEEFDKRRDLFRETCESLDMLFIDATAIDPEDGIVQAESFILEDVKRKVADNGKNTAFFSTDCDLQKPLIWSILEEGAIYPQQCHPSPYHIYPEVLGVSMPEDKGDTAYLLSEIKAAIAEKGATNRFSTWPISANILFLEAGVVYSAEYLKGEITERNDKEALKAIFDDIIGIDDAVTFEEAIGNLYKIQVKFIDF